MSLKLVKHMSIGTESFYCDKILASVKNTTDIESGVIAQDSQNVYHFDNNGKDYSVVSNIVDSSKWNIKDCEKVVSKVIGRSRCRLYTKYASYESHIQLGFGSLELLHWKILAKNRLDIFSNVYEPELYEGIMVSFCALNNISVDAHIFLDGRFLIICKPMLNSVTLDACMEEATSVCEIVKNINN